MDEFISGSRLNPEVASVLHGVFVACDENKDGFISVKNFITFLKEKATGTEILNFLDDLTPILDEEGTNPAIDWQTCEEGLEVWIKYVNDSNIIGSYSTPTSGNSPIKQLLNSPKIVDSPFPFGKQKKNISNVSSTYSNDSFEASDLSWDHNDIQVRLEELENTNKRLLEDNSKLKYELLNTEDQNSIILQENDHLKSNVARHEKLLEDSKKLYKSYDELKLTVVEYQNLKNDLIDRTCLLEKENNSLQHTLTHYESKISKLDASLEVVKEEKIHLTHEISIHKNLFNQIEDLKTSKECIVEESDNKSEYMSALIAELSLANEVLKAQKSTIEHELSEVKQDVCRISMINQIQSTPLLSSTRCEPWVPSLHQELIAEMDIETESYNSNNSSVCHHLDFSDTSDYSPSVSKPGSPQQYTKFAQQCRDKFKEKKQMVFTKIEEIVKQQEKTLDNSRASLIVEDLNRDLESFTEKIAEFAQGKQTAEKRALKLAATLKKIKEEKESLSESRDKALQRIGDISISTQEAQEKLHSALQEIEIYKKTIGEMKNETSVFKDSTVSLLDKSNQCSFQNALLVNDDLEGSQNQIEDLKRLVFDLESRNLDSSRKIFDLEEEMNSKNDEITNTKNQMKNLEVSLGMMKKQHNTEIQSILKAIPIVDDTNEIQGVRESPEGGPQYCDTSDHIYALKQQNHSLVRLSQKTHKEHRNIFSQTEKLFTKEGGAQTDLDMLGMNKLLENYDFFAPDVRTLPQRLRKHNSIDISDVACEPAFQSQLSLSQNILEEKLINPLEECLVETNPLNLSNEELLGLNSDIDSDTDALDKNTADFGACSSEYSALSNVTANESNDENNNETIDSRQVEGQTSEDKEDTSKESTDDDDSNVSTVDNAGTKKTPVNLFVANIIDYGRSDVSSDSENDSERVNENRKLSFTRTRRKRILQQQRKSKVSADEETIEEEVSKTSAEKQKDTDITSKVSTGGEGSPNRRRRRVGVSAEPVRVSWSTLRESFKKLQFTSNLNDIDQVSPTCDGNSDFVDTDNESINTSNVEACEVSEEQLDSLIQNIPSIEVNTHESDQGEDIEAKEDRTSSEASSASSSVKTSLKIPSTTQAASAGPTPVGSLDFSSQSYIDDKEFEKKFNNLVFSFKTDIYTLEKRLETQERARDVSEASMDKEITKLSKAVQDVQTFERSSDEYSQVVSTLGRQSDILRKAAMKISAQSEQHGSYQQENRMCQNFETIIQYADTLRFNMTKMKNELEELRLGLANSSTPELSEYHSSTEDKFTDNEFPKTEIVSTQNLNVEKSTAPTTRRTFSSITKTLVMAQGMSKFGKPKQKQEEPVETLPQPQDETMATKRVKFGETSFSQDVDEIEVESDDSCPSILQWIQESKLSRQIMTLVRKFLPLVLTLLLIYMILYVFAKSLEIDTLRLHDRLLRYIPHTIEPAQPKSDDR